MPKRGVSEKKRSLKNLKATHINYHNVCKRKLWLLSNGINMEHTSDTVYDGKMLHETSYLQRNKKHSELSIEAAQGKRV